MRAKEVKSSRLYKRTHILLAHLPLEDTIEFVVSSLLLSHNIRSDTLAIVPFKSGVWLYIPGDRIRHLRPDFDTAMGWFKAIVRGARLGARFDKELMAPQGCIAVCVNLASKSRSAREPRTTRDSNKAACRMKPSDFIQLTTLWGSRDLKKAPCYTILYAGSLHSPLGESTSCQVVFSYVYARPGLAPSLVNILLDRLEEELDLLPCLKASMESKP